MANRFNLSPMSVEPLCLSFGSPATAWYCDGEVRWGGLGHGRGDMGFEGGASSPHLNLIGPLCPLLQDRVVLAGHAGTFLMVAWVIHGTTTSNTHMNNACGALTTELHLE